MITIHRVKDLRAAIRQQRTQGKRIGLVPTMGNLHAGHVSLVKQAKELCDYVVTSIFVNPLQFGANEDLDKYPRTLDADKEKLVAAGNHLLFTPEVSQLYPEGLERHTKVITPGLSELHCGASRPSHFTGVTTVVSMLFNMVQPDVAIFGEKDFQQLAVIRKMTRDLYLPIVIESGPTLRETDGLAMSSRNGYLSAEQRQTAPLLYKLLQESAEQIENGDKDFAAISAEANNRLTKAGFVPDYFNIVNSDTLSPAVPSDSDITILAAAYLGTTRLIDNISVHLG
ncbi:pantoate--beta-alanine ligase [Hahella chejuensis KCTC 2396]|uniref:Pantothenate synthetase n=1 Tax=Hahella chejuensis (strain KCTC 2396) TaxID=349521 RepID=PANC_HAHCH|nr:pantoate--beta-alanine ligase [Hahella chejuensis]Q2S8W2.1 RecName: Full=Pantothenate synthetase; Short=PS; AltName: Full=Pantoate--beta-alanine ligase; AltName: Full=Pantoate-activating enzyme [Hahella chejuensis KCTC 2396]ABC32912.1 pantoate--beta-alanine ligase [Hahella chejuensis KCTC 2396]